MRLWHKDLIPVLPKQQLMGQWRECCAIARNIAVNGTPNHLLVNKVMGYPKWHFVRYAEMVADECFKRGYMCDWNRIEKWLTEWQEGAVKYLGGSDSIVYENWHNSRYFRQCYFNLQEKYDCGGISLDEWVAIKNHALKERTSYETN